MMSKREPIRRADIDAENMNLPVGMTCGGCVHSRRCTMMFSHIPESPPSVSLEFSPTDSIKVSYG